MKVYATITLKVTDRAEFRQCYNNWHEAMEDILENLNLGIIECQTVSDLSTGPDVMWLRCKCGFDSDIALVCTAAEEEHVPAQFGATCPWCDKEYDEDQLMTLEQGQDINIGGTA